MAEFDWTERKPPGHYINRITRAMARIADQRLKKLGFASAQLPVLTSLKGGKKLTQRELAVLAKVEQPTMAQLLSRMERDGLVRREPDPTDGRSSLLSLTKTAVSRLPEGRAVLHKMNNEALRGLSKAEVEMFLLFLQRVLENIETAEKDL